MNFYKIDLNKPGTPRNNFLEVDFWWRAPFCHMQHSCIISFISQLKLLLGIVKDIVEVGGVHSRLTKFRYLTTCWSALLQNPARADVASLHFGFCCSAEEALPSAQWRGPGWNLGALQT